MIDKKTIKKSLVILLLIVIIIVAIVQIGRTLARYESTATSTGEADVAFWVVGNSYQSQRLFINDIYPTNTPFTYTFTVSNFNSDGKRAETDMEYEILLTASTNLPLNYVIKKDGETCITRNHTDGEGLSADDSDTYYRQMRLTTAENELTMNQDTDVTHTFTIEITFPKSNSVNADYADLMEYINIDLSAKQVIGE